MDSMEQQTIEYYENGELVETRTAFVPAPPPTHPARLLARMDELHARNQKLETRLNNINVNAINARLARIEERLSRIAGSAASMTPNAITDSGTRGELAKIKESLIAADEGVS